MFQEWLKGLGVGVVITAIVAWLNSRRGHSIEARKAEDTSLHQHVAHLQEHITQQDKRIHDLLVRMDDVEARFYKEKEAHQEARNEKHDLRREVRAKNVKIEEQGQEILELKSRVSKLEQEQQSQ